MRLVLLLSPVYSYGKWRREGVRLINSRAGIYFFKSRFGFVFLAAQQQNLSSRPGMEPVPPAVEAQSLNHWTTREVPRAGILTQAVLL